jgi:hypothetical protein
LCEQKNRPQDVGFPGKALEKPMKIKVDRAFVHPV